MRFHHDTTPKLACFLFSEIVLLEDQEHGTGKRRDGLEAHPTRSPSYQKVET